MILTLKDLFIEAQNIGLQSGECLIGVTHTSGHNDYKLLFFHAVLIKKAASNQIHSVDRCPIGANKSANIFSVSLDFSSLQGMISGLTSSLLKIPFAPAGRDTIEHGLDIEALKSISYLPSDSRRNAALSFLPFRGLGLTVYELFDLSKKALADISVADIQKIDQMLAKHTDFSMAQESARVGNLILTAALDPYQIDFRGDKTGMGLHIMLSPRWVGLNPADYILTTSADFNGEITRSSLVTPIQNSIHLPNFDARGLIDLQLWDIKKQSLVARNFGHLLQRINSHISIMSHSRRGFIRNAKGETVHEKTISTQIPMNEGPLHGVIQWPDQVLEQIRQAEKEALIEQKKIIQFNNGSHLRALLEIVAAIDSLGICEELKVWDPYIGDYYLDFLTLLGGVKQIKVLSALEQAGKDNIEKGLKRLIRASELCALDYRQKMPTTILRWVEERREKRRLSAEQQRNTEVRNYLAELRGIGLKIEFRYRKGNHGGAFHDRFIIGGGRCWSAGSSLNSIGSAHSLMLEVAYPEIVEREFDKLWDSVGENIF